MSGSRTAELAVALDVESAERALRLVDEIGGAVRWYKIGPMLHLGAGPPLVAELLRRDKRVFLDLKWHDIPHAVAGATAGAARLGASLATVHLAGGRRMLEAAVAAGRGGLKLIGVGVLTSLDADAFAEVVGRPVGDLAEEQARLVRQGVGAGLDGFVVSAGEAKAVRGLAGEASWLVIPGIRGGEAGPGAGAGAGARFAISPADDQRRIATAAQAAAAGADLVVVGRAVTQAKRPLVVVDAVVRELGGVG